MQVVHELNLLPRRLFFLLTPCLDELSSIHMSRFLVFKAEHLSKLTSTGDGNKQTLQFIIMLIVLSSICSFVQFHVSF